MTHEEIDAMPAGPKLDALACEALGIEPHRRMVFTGVSENRTALLGHYEDDYEPISTCIDAAARASLECSSVNWWRSTEGTIVLSLSRGSSASTEAATFPLAIARAIAKTKEEA